MKKIKMNYYIIFWWNFFKKTLKFTLSLAFNFRQIETAVMFTLCGTCQQCCEAGAAWSWERFFGRSRIWFSNYRTGNFFRAQLQILVYRAGARVGAAFLAQVGADPIWP